MLYISHLSFNTEHEDGEPCHGYLTCVVEDPDVEAALEKTRDLLLRLKADEDVFEASTRSSLSRARRLGLSERKGSWRPSGSGTVRASGMMDEAKRRRPTLL